MQVSTKNSERLHLTWLLYSFGNRLLFKIQGKQFRNKRNTSSNGSITATELHSMEVGRVPGWWHLPPSSTRMDDWSLGPSFLCFQLLGYIRRREKMQQIFPNIYNTDSFCCIPRSACSQTEKVKRFSQSHVRMEAVYQCIVQMMFKTSHYYRNKEKSSFTINNSFTLT